MHKRLQEIVDAIPPVSSLARMHALLGLTLLSKYLEAPSDELLRDLRAVFEVQARGKDEVRQECSPASGSN